MATTRVRVSASGVAHLHMVIRDRVTEPLADAVASDMERLVPVLSGDLKGTIEPEVVDWDECRVYFGDPSTGVDYHLYVEDGTTKMDAQPYARPALYRVRSF